MRKLVGGAGLSVSALLLASCDGMAGFEQVTEDFHQVYTLPAGGHLDLSNRNGSLDVIGWDRDTVEVSGTKYAQDPDALREVKVKMDQDGDRLTIRTDTGHQGNWPGGNRGVRYHIRAPHRFLLDRLETTNGSVTVEDLEGGGELQSTNGKLSLARLHGRYRASTTNGSVEAEDCSGLLRLDTTNGSIRAHLQEGVLEAKSTNGSLDVSIQKPEADRSIHLGTTNGSVSLALAEFHHNDVRIDATHGGVTLRLPESIDAHLRAQTSLASIHSDLPLSQTEESSKHALRGRLGAGGAEIEATTSTGAIRLEKY